MNNAAVVNDLLAGLGEASGLPLALEDGVCGIELADGRQLVVAAPADADLLYVYVVFMDVDRERRSAVAVEAMKWNFFDPEMGGSWLALDADGGKLLLCACRQASALDSRGFENLVLNLSELAGKLAERFSRAEENPPPERRAQSEFDPRFGRKV